MGRPEKTSPVMRRARLARMRAWYADLCHKVPEAPLVERAFLRRQIEQIEKEVVN